MKNTNTAWSSPKTNFLAGINCLRKALASGSNAKLIRMYNEDCYYPIKVQESEKNIDIRSYNFSNGALRTRAEIMAGNQSDVDKNLTLNYTTCYGKQKAVDTYYETGMLSKDNLIGVGKSHLVMVTDLIAYYRSTKRSEHIAKRYEDQYINIEGLHEKHFFDFFTHNHQSKFLIKKFKKKLWVVVILSKDEPKPKTPLLVNVLNWVTYPLKFIPRKSVLKMPEYTNYTFR